MDIRVKEEHEHDGLKAMVIIALIVSIGAIGYLLYENNRVSKINKEIEKIRKARITFDLKIDQFGHVLTDALSDSAAYFRHIGGHDGP